MASVCLWDAVTVEEEVGGTMAWDAAEMAWAVGRGGTCTFGVGAASSAVLVVVAFTDVVACCWCSAFADVVMEASGSCSVEPGLDAEWRRTTRSAFQSTGVAINTLIAFAPTYVCTANHIRRVTRRIPPSKHICTHQSCGQYQFR